MASFLKIKRVLLNRHRASFSLVEMVVSLGVLMLLLAIIAAVTQGTMLAIHKSTGNLSTFAAARTAFDTVNQELAQATLNTYVDYYGTTPSSTSLSVQTSSNNSTTTGSTFTPVTYGRVSNLQFLVKQNSNPATTFNTAGSAGSTGYGQEVYFQCPEASSTNQYYQSTPGLLNACGFYVQYCSDSGYEPQYTTGNSMISNVKYRYRLMQAIEPSESLQVYADAISDNTAWTANIANTGPWPTATALAPDAIPLADNVIAMVIWPRLPLDQDAVGTNLAPNYYYDSQYETAPVASSTSASGYAQPLTADQLPPIVQVTLVVIDEASAARLCTSSTPPTVIETALKGLFINPANYETDLASLQASLIANHINFQVLNTSIVMRESKWSQ